MMQLPQDKLRHLTWGAGLALALAAVAAVAVGAGAGYAIAAGSALFGWAVERYQAVRREGTPSRADMVFSAAPGVALGVLVQVLL